MIGSAALSWRPDRSARGSGYARGRIPRRFGSLRSPRARPWMPTPRRVVHHGEHGRQALVHFADQIPGGAVEVHHAGGRGLDAHLVLDGAAGQRVLLTQRTVGIDHHLGHDKQRDALRAGGASGSLASTRWMMLGEIMFPAGDEDLGAADTIAAVGLGSALVRIIPKSVPACGSVRHYGAGPDAGVHVRQVLRLQRFAGVVEDRQAGAGGQHRVQAERQVGRVDHLLDLSADHLGMPMPPNSGEPPTPTQPPSA